MTKWALSQPLSFEHTVLWKSIWNIYKKNAELPLYLHKGSEKVDKAVNAIFLLEFLATST